MRASVADGDTTDRQAENPFAAGCAWTDGKYVPIGEGRTPMLDFGYIHSDLTYDVVAVWDGRFFRLEDHLARLERGCERLRLAPPFPRERVREILAELVRRTALRRAYVEAIVSRGVPRAGERDLRKAKACFYAYAIPYVWLACPEQQAKGVDAVVVESVRRVPSDAIDPTVKSFHWGDLTRALFEAYDRGSSFPILTDGSGLVTEGAGYNVFAFSGGRLLTAREGVLEGITRLTAIEIAREQGHEVVVGELPVTALREADEVFLTSTAGGVMPVAALDGRPVGSGKPGPVTSRIRERYWELHADPAYTRAVEYAA